MAERIYLFKRFERFWHWSQALLMITLLLTGFEVHNTYHLLGFDQAVQLHSAAAWTLIGLWVFAIFWHFTTGEWKQYIPTLKNVDAMVKYYLTGIFTDAPHPFKPSALRKHNPLQRLAYLSFWIFISPLVWVSGWLYLFYGSWENWELTEYLTLEWIAFFHVAAAFMVLAFLIVHMYLITTGHTIGAHLKAMITGWEVND